MFGPTLKSFLFELKFGVPQECPPSLVVSNFCVNWGCTTCSGWQLRRPRFHILNRDLVVLGENLITFEAALE